MNSITHWGPFQNLSTLQEQVDRLFESKFQGRGDDSALTTWAPAVDIYETENDLVLQADLPGIAEARGIKAQASKGQRHDERQQLKFTRMTGAGSFLRPPLCMVAKVGELQDASNGQTDGKGSRSTASGAG